MTLFISKNNERIQIACGDKMMTIEELFTSHNIVATVYHKLDCRKDGSKIDTTTIKYRRV